MSLSPRRRFSKQQQQVLENGVIKVLVLGTPLSKQMTPSSLYMNNKTQFILACTSTTNTATVILPSSGDTYTKSCPLFKLDSNQQKSTITLALYDIIGNHKDLSALRSAQYKDAHVVIFVYSMADLDTYDDIITCWYPEFCQTKSGNHLCTLLVGTEQAYKEVSTLQASTLATMVHAQDILECNVQDTSTIAAWLLHAMDKHVIKACMPRRSLFVTSQTKRKWSQMLLHSLKNIKMEPHVVQTSNNVQQQEAATPEAVIDNSNLTLQDLPMVHVQDVMEWPPMRVLGAGMEGSVYMVKMKETNHIYALKQIVSCGKEQVEQILNQVRGIQSLELKHVTPYKAAFYEPAALDQQDTNTLIPNQQQQLYTCSLLMNYCEYGTVLDLIQSFQAFPSTMYASKRGARIRTPIITETTENNTEPSQSPSFVLTMSDLTSLVYQLVQGVASLHEHGYMHRDIKSANIFLDANEGLQLGDLGRTKKNPQQQHLSLAGTCITVAPEIMMQHQTGAASYQYDSSADVFSLGCVIYEMITHKTTLMFAHIQQDEKAYHKRMIQDMIERGYKDKQLHKLVCNCLRKNPKKRWTIQQCLLTCKALKSEYHSGAESDVQVVTRLVQWMHMYAPKQEEEQAMPVLATDEENAATIEENHEQQQEQQELETSNPTDLAITEEDTTVLSDLKSSNTSPTTIFVNSEMRLPRLLKMMITSEEQQRVKKFFLPMEMEQKLWSEVVAFLASKCNVSATCSVTYMDAEQDLVEITEDEDWQIALRDANNKKEIKLHIQA